MWRSKKLIIVAVLAAVMLAGSISGVALAQTENGDDSQPGARFGALLEKVCAIYNANPDRTSDIDCDLLEAAFADARSQMPDECQYPGVRPAHGLMAQVFESFGYDQEAVQAAFEQARTELEDGTLEGGRGAVMARVLEILGIDDQDWQAACAEVRQAYQEMRGEKPEGRPFAPGFGFHGMGGLRGFSGPCAPAE